MFYKLTYFRCWNTPRCSKFQVRKPAPLECHGFWPLLGGLVHLPAISPELLTSAHLSFRCYNHRLPSVCHYPKWAIIYIVTFAFALLTQRSQSPECNWIQQYYSLTCHINSHPGKMRPKGVFREVLRRPVSLNPLFGFLRNAVLFWHAIKIKQSSIFQLLYLKCAPLSLQMLLCGLLYWNFHSALPSVSYVYQYFQGKNSVFHLYLGCKVIKLSGLFQLYLYQT